MTDHMTTLNEVVEIYDGPHATPKKTDSGPYFLSISSLDSGRLDLTKSAYLHESDFKKWTKRVTPREGDLLFSYETRLGEAALMPKGVKACLGRRMGLLRPKSGKVISEYLLYEYLSPYFQQVITRNTIVGATVNRIALSEMGDFPIRIPPLSEQAVISDLLMSIDKKIELNNKINTELEAMAKLIYDYWFVQFDFPDANGKPYKSSGGKMVYNEELKREIPEGWISSNILEVSSLLGGGTPSKKNPAYWGGDIPFFTPSDSDSNVFSLTTEDYITKAGLKGSSTKLFDKHTVFITARGSVGRLALNAVPMAMNQSCYAFKAKPGYSYAYLFFLVKELIHHLKVKSSGSVFNSIVSNDIEWTKLALPADEKIIEAYAKVVEPMFERIEQATKENLELGKLRDWLLPMLMNGQVTVTTDNVTEGI